MDDTGVAGMPADRPVATPAEGLGNDPGAGEPEPKGAVSYSKAHGASIFAACPICLMLLLLISCELALVLLVCVKSFFSRHSVMPHAHLASPCTGTAGLDSVPNELSAAPHPHNEDTTRMRWCVAVSPWRNA